MAKRISGATATQKSVVSARYVCTAYALLTVMNIITIGFPQVQIRQPATRREWQRPDKPASRFWQIIGMTTLVWLVIHVTVLLFIAP